MLDFSLYSLSYGEIESIYTHEELLKHYFPDLKLGKNCSPFRKDSNPSFSIFKYNGNLYFKDLKTGDKGNIYVLIGKLIGKDFEGVLRAITQEIWAKNPKTHKITKKIIEKEAKKQLDLSVKRRAWNEDDVVYWSQFGISHETLLRYNVAPIEFIFIEGKVVKCDKLAYVYKEIKDGIITLKTYQPYSEDFKWRSNCLEANAVWEGWSQLPETGDLLIWTKSRKDVMSIFETTSVPAISLQSESMIPKKQVVNQLKKRFKTIILLYDNDWDSTENWGRNLGKKLSELFNLKQIEIDESYKAKDYSTLYSIYKQQAIQIFNNMIT
jgi:hypothetical protein